MKNILLPTDFSEISWNAIKYALSFFKNDTCNFYLLHVNRLSTLDVADSPYLPTGLTVETIYFKPSKRKLKVLLKRIAIEVDFNINHKFYTLTDHNFIIESIRKHVKEKNIDMIVMGTKGASGLKEYIVGSNTGDVITKVKCTTLVIPEKAKHDALKEIAFPTDFALTYDIVTLQPIYDILEKTNASLRVLHINKKDEQLTSEQQENKELLADFFEGLNNSFHVLTNKKIEDAVQCFVDSRDIEMMAMVAKNLNYFQHILFHSKIEKISYHIKIPFLVLHE
jgi:nucleotide-binding universal stress UspA family protein